MIDLSALQTWCEGKHAWSRELLEALVRLESPSHDKAAVDRCGAELLRRLETCGARCERIPTLDRGDHVRAEIAGEGTQTLILGHFDTVWDVGQIERMPLREEDGRLYGPGIFDMKGGLATALLALRALQAVPGAARPRVVMLWTTDEEVGSRTSRRLIEDEARRSGAVLVLEPSLPGGAAKTSRKGCGEFELRRARRCGPRRDSIRARAPARSTSWPARSSSSSSCRIWIAASPSTSGWSAGGTRPNVTAAEARATIDVRVPTHGGRRAGRRGDARPQPADAGDVARGSRRLRAPAARTERRPLLRLYEMAREVAPSLGRDLPEGAAGGGSDGNFTAALGVPTLDGLGPQGDGAHALHEHVLLD